MCATMPVRPLAIMIRETPHNLKLVWLASFQLDVLVGELMELMTRWNIKDMSHDKDKEEGSVTSKSKDFKGCNLS